MSYHSRPPRAHLPIPTELRDTSNTLDRFSEWVEHIRQTDETLSARTKELRAKRLWMIVEQGEKVVKPDTTSDDVIEGLWASAQRHRTFLENGRAASLGNLEMTFGPSGLGALRPMKVTGLVKPYHRLFQCKLCLKKQVQVTFMSVHQTPRLVYRVQLTGI